MRLCAAHLFVYKWEWIFHSGILESDGQLLLLLTCRAQQEVEQGPEHRNDSHQRRDHLQGKGQSVIRRDPRR